MQTPKLVKSASANQKCYRAKSNLMESCGLPLEQLPDWDKQAIRKLDELRRKYKSLQVYLDICAKCGACSDKCHFFLGTGDPRNMPMARADLLRKVYKRYFTLGGKLFGKMADAEGLTDAVLEDWYTYFYQCSECRRCAVFCPYGIDTAEITRAAREIMASVGVATKYVTEVVQKVYQIGNNLGIPEAAWIDNSEFLEDEIKEETGLDIKLPVNQEGAEVLLIPPSADLFANTDTMIAYAKMFYAAGISWTTSTYASEGGNFGLFLDYRNMKGANKRIVDGARALKVKRIVMGECGHAWRAAQAFTDTLNGPLDFLESPRPQHICEWTVEMMRKGAFKLDKSANDDKIVTYHDPCNVARAGGVVEEPREIIRAVVSNFREMHPDTIRERTFCCGAGGGLLTDEIMDLRMKGGGPRAEACRATGANYLATPCAICKAQLPKVMEHYNVDVTVGGVSELVGNALVLK